MKKEKVSSRSTKFQAVISVAAACFLTPTPSGYSSPVVTLLFPSLRLRFHSEFSECVSRQPFLLLTQACALAMSLTISIFFFPSSGSLVASCCPIHLLLLLLSHFSRVRLCATPERAAHQVPLSLGFSRQEHWSGLPFPSPMQESEK